MSLRQSFRVSALAGRSLWLRRGNAVRWCSSGQTDTLTEMHDRYPSLFAYPPGASSTEAPPPASPSPVQVAGAYFSLDRSVIPEGLPAGLEQEFSLSTVEELMVRKPALRVIEKLERIASRQNTCSDHLTLLRGRAGSGKSATLSHVVQWCRENGWLVMFIPRPRDWVTEKGAIESGTGTAAPLSVSKLHPGLYGQPLGAQRVLQCMLDAHGKQLVTLPQRRKYEHTSWRNKSSPEGEPTLMDICKKGLSSLVAASDALYDLRMELSLVEEFPVLIAVDEINALYGETCFYSQGKRVRADELMLASAFRVFGPRGGGELIVGGHAPKHGAIICCTTERHSTSFSVAPFQDAVEPVPSSFVEHVKLFSEDEIRLALQHYTDHGVYCSSRGIVTDEDVTYMKLVTLGVARECRRRAEASTAEFGAVQGKRVRET